MFCMKISNSMTNVVFFFLKKKKKLLDYTHTHNSIQTPHTPTDEI
jgi:hypothetical protein